MAIQLKPNERIETDKLVLIRRNLDQADELFQLIDRNREHLRYWMPWEQSTVGIEDTQDFIKSCLEWWKNGDAYEYSLHDKQSGKMIGGFGLHSIRQDKRRCDLGYWLDKDFEGKGFISECIRIGEEIARVIGLHRLVITCDRLNKKSATVALNNGFLQEARQLDENIDRGRYRDTLRFYKLLNPPLENAYNDNLPEGFSIRDMEATEFWSLVDVHLENVFKGEVIVRPANLISEEEKTQLKELGRNFQWPYAYYLGLFYDDRLVGWTWGYQDNRESCYMVNSAVLPEYRGRGLYSRLLDFTVDRLKQKGFQKIWSRHTFTNNAVIIPKLKKGFVITGTELSDTFGSLVHLSYMTNPTRRKLLDYRAGQSRPDQTLRKHLKL